MVTFLLPKDSFTPFRLIVTVALVLQKEEVHSGLEKARKEVDYQGSPTDSICQRLSPDLISKATGFSVKQVSMGTLVNPTKDRVPEGMSHLWF